MKPIELTEEHKSKLLEMCNKLFPQYKEQAFYTNAQDNGAGFAKEYLYLGNNKKGLGIHWFEFCMIHLFNKLLKRNYINAPAFYTSILGKIHPIDYLYEQFNKMK